MPIGYNYNNLISNVVSPASFKVKNSGLSNFFKRLLFQRALSAFEWQGIPENWSKDYFTANLFAFGYVAVINTKKFGIIPQVGSLSGYDVFYRPTEVIISNPAFRSTVTAYISKNTELIRLTPDYTGILDIVGYYADMLAVASESVAVNLINTKTTPIFEAFSKSEAETLKKMYDAIARGEPCVVTDGNVTRLSDRSAGFNFFTPPTNAMFVSDKLLESMRTIENMFDTIIGIPNGNLDKKERMIVDEVNKNNAETMSIASTWLDCLQTSLEKVNDMFNLNISVRFRFEQEVNENATVDTLD